MHFFGDRFTRAICRASMRYSATLFLFGRPIKTPSPFFFFFQKGGVMNFLIRTALSLSLCFLFFVSAGQLYGQVTYSLSGNFETSEFLGFERPLDGESFVAEFVIDTSVLDADPDSDRGEYPGAILSASIEFESGFVSEVDFSGGTVTVQRDLAGGGIFLQDEAGDSTILVYDLGNSFETDGLPVDPAMQFTPSPDSIVVLAEPTLGSIFAFLEVDLGEALSRSVFAVISTQVNSVVLGDCNLDGAVTFDDIPAMITALAGGTFLAQADCNQDAEVNFGDIPSFIEILLNN